MMIESLKNNFLHSFYLDRDPFAIFDGRLYTFSAKRTNSLSVNIDGKVYGLIPSLRIDELENNFNIDNGDNIKLEAQNQFRRRYGNVDIKLEEKKELENILSSMKSQTLAQFFMVDLYEAYYKIIRQKTAQPDLEFIQLGITKNSLEGIIKPPGIVVFDNDCYEFELRQARKSQIHFTYMSTTYPLKHWISLEKLSRLYVYGMDQSLQNMMKDSYSSAKSLSDALDTQIFILKKQYENLSKLDSLTQSNRGSLYFQKVSDFEYKVWIHHPKFIMRRGKDHYLFEEADVGVKVNQYQNGYMISRPVVFNEGYAHPFYGGPSGESCWAGTDWGKEPHNLDVAYNLDTRIKKENFASVLAKVLDKGVSVLVQPYATDAAVFHHQIENFSYKLIPGCRDGALNFASLQQIPIEHIYDNTHKNDKQK